MGNFRSKEEEREYNKAYYQSRKKELIGRAHKRATGHRKTVIALVNKAKSVPCEDCGKSFPTVCMDLHHVTGTKIATVCHMVSNGYPIEAVQAEIEKCVPLCAICHRLRHWRLTGMDEDTALKAAAV